MKLKRCPHCNGKGTLKTSYYPKGNNYYTFIKCQICQAQGKPIISKELPQAKSLEAREAARAWNLRAYEEKPKKGA